MVGSVSHHRTMAYAVSMDARSEPVLHCTAISPNYDSLRCQLYLITYARAIRARAPQNKRIIYVEGRRVNSLPDNMLELIRMHNQMQ